MTGSAACEICGHASPLWRSIEGYPHYRCGRCGHLFVFPKPSQPDLDRFYASGDYYRTAEDQLPRLRRDAEERLIHLERLCVKFGLERKLLDVGCATGTFLGVGMARGWNATGVDRSEEIASKARRRVGCDVHSGIFESLAIPGAPFPVVTAWEVIEHARDPQAFFRGLSENVAAGGVLALSTPRGDGLPARVLGAHYPMLIPPEHLCIFSRLSLRLLADAHGFDEIGFLSFSNLTFQSLASGYSKLLFGAALSEVPGSFRAVCKLLAGVSIGLPRLIDWAGYGTEMLVFVRKRRQEAPRLRCQ